MCVFLVVSRTRDTWHVWSVDNVTFLGVCRSCSEVSIKHKSLFQGNGSGKKTGENVNTWEWGSGMVIVTHFEKRMIPTVLRHGFCCM